MVDVTGPLAHLVGQAGDSGWLTALAEQLVAPAPPNSAAVVEAVTARVADPGLVVPALSHAGVLDGSGALTPVAPLRLASVAAAVTAARAYGLPVSLAVTVPGFMSAAWAAVSPGLGVRPTAVVLRDIAAGACSSLVVASPFLQQVVSPWLTAAVARVTDGGGSVLVVTRALTPACGAVSVDNQAVVADVRAAAVGDGVVQVVSWEGPGLGMHCKVVAADGQVAYVGSANLTGPGAASNAEAGVVLSGPPVDSLLVWVSALAASCTQL